MGPPAAGLKKNAVLRFLSKKIITIANTIDGVVKSNNIEVINVPHTNKSKSIQPNLGSLPFQIVKIKFIDPIVDEIPEIINPNIHKSIPGSPVVTLNGA